MWGHELALMLQHCEKQLSEDSEIDRKSLKSLARQLKMSMRELWDEASGDVFELGYALPDLYRRHI